MPLGEDTFRYQLPTINSRDDIPADFNPELSCAFTLSMQVGASGGGGCGLTFC